MESNKKRFGDVGLTNEANDALSIFIEAVDLELFNRNLRKVFHFYLLGVIHDGWIIDDTDLPLIKQMIQLFELMEVLENEYIPD